MKMIVGLGNPGTDYAGTRHNVGFLVIKALAKSWRIALKSDRRTCSLSGRRSIRGQEAVLAMPLTFMNLSGPAVRALCKKYGTEVCDLLVVCDDLDLELGRIKIRPSGSAGGHRGLQSIIDSLGASDFCRLRIGIDRPPAGRDAAEYVLSAFARRQQPQLKEAIGRSCLCCQSWLTDGMVKTMNIFNARS